MDVIAPIPSFSSSKKCQDTNIYIKILKIFKEYTNIKLTTNYKIPEFVIYFITNKIHPSDVITSSENLKKYPLRKTILNLGSDMSSFTAPKIDYTITDFFNCNWKSGNTCFNSDIDDVINVLNDYNIFLNEIELFLKQPLYNKYVNAIMEPLVSNQNIKLFETSNKKTTRIVDEDNNNYDILYDQYFTFLETNFEHMITRSTINCLMYEFLNNTNEHLTNSIGLFLYFISDNPFNLLQVIKLSNTCSANNPKSDTTVRNYLKLIKWYIVHCSEYYKGNVNKELKEMDKKITTKIHEIDPFYLTQITPIHNQLFNKNVSPEIVNSNIIGTFEKKFEKIKELVGMYSTKVSFGKTRTRRTSRKTTRRRKRTSVSKRRRKTRRSTKRLH